MMKSRLVYDGIIFYDHTGRAVKVIKTRLDGQRDYYYIAQHGENSNYDFFPHYDYCKKTLEKKPPKEYQQKHAVLAFVAKTLTADKKTVTDVYDDLVKCL